MSPRLNALKRCSFTHSGLTMGWGRVGWESGGTSYSVKWEMRGIENEVNATKKMLVEGSRAEKPCVPRVANVTRREALGSQLTETAVTHSHLFVTVGFYKLWEHNAVLRASVAEYLPALSAVVPAIEEGKLLAASITVQHVHILHKQRRDRLQIIFVFGRVYCLPVDAFEQPVPLKNRETTALRRAKSGSGVGAEQFFAETAGSLGELGRVAELLGLFYTVEQPHKPVPAHLKGPCPCCHLIHKTPQRPQVRNCRQRRAGQSLRREVLVGAAERLPPALLRGHSRQGHWLCLRHPRAPPLLVHEGGAEVHNLDVHVGVEQNVLRLQIAVDDALGGEVLQA
eukprot:Hpha_TRINITY_DN13231_c0_g2::TRINITY_DN13231_c0_g2_i1::g.154820::m.154820